MTATTSYLDYEVALLLAKYGKSAVLNALAAKMQLSLDELESQLKQIPNKKRRGRSSKNPASAGSIEDLIRQHPEKETLLRELQGHFQRRAFLPELRDVRRFFEQNSRDLGAPKSRAESLRPLFSLLCELPLPELEGLCRADSTGGFSSLGVISDEILRGGRPLTNG
jgi:hypothetical protein